ncbi:hypothetical protein B0H34DRAFT_675177 [Crassisporium funariophilum]|nr:hypothetical protein B0H34DRAFT_675177 [Crassisporium funariophilum]
MDVQAKIPPGLSAVHNFIMDHDSTDLQHYFDILNNLDISSDPFDPTEFGEAGRGAIERDERERASTLWDQIASQMWDSYQQYLHNHPEVLEENFAPEYHRLYYKLIIIAATIKCCQ